MYKQSIYTYLACVFESDKRQTTEPIDLMFFVVTLMIKGLWPVAI